MDPDGPDGEPVVTPVSELAAGRLFWVPALLVADYIPIPKWNLITGTGLSLIIWTAVFFPVFLVARKTISLKSKK